MWWSMLALLLLSCSQMFAQRPGDICPQNTDHRQHDVTANPVPTVDPKLFNKRRYRSPRVLFSEQPPDSEPAGQQTRSRTKRKAGAPQHRGVYSVCESISIWEGNKTKATDISGNEVTVLPDVIINNSKKKQYFFETTCSSGRTGGSGCLGIDARHWNSYCTNSHTFVRSADYIQEPGGVETRKNQCSLCVCTEPKVLETIINRLLFNMPALALWYQTHIPLCDGGHFH